jgi:hypothetical protein
MSDDKKEQVDFEQVHEQVVTSARDIVAPIIDSLESIQEMMKDENNLKALMEELARRLGQKGNPK